MGKIGKEKDIDFAISTGDNFYDNGLSGIDDTAFEESFTHIYTAPSLQKQWYSGKCINYCPFYSLISLGLLNYQKNFFNVGYFWHTTLVILQRSFGRCNK